ncbi:MAG: hypothetical protein ABIN61_05450 [candidate division WOR-3 bacterium]
MINTLETLIERSKSPELVHLFVPDLDKLLEKKMDMTLDLELDLVNVKISQSVHHLPWKVWF